MTGTHQTHGDEAPLDVLVVGAGFAGMYMLVKLRELGLRTRVLEAASDVGGTWYWNRYPGARCDAPSLEYSYSWSALLDDEWDWSERFARQPEILRYAQYVADRFDLRRDIQFETRVIGAEFNDQDTVWRVTTDTGETFIARYCIMATGTLSVPVAPDVPGLSTFDGEVLHTGSWPKEGRDLRGKRVAVIGTGSSGVQSIPAIAGDAVQLYVFQRTPNYVIPAQNRPFTKQDMAEGRARYPELRALMRASGNGFAVEPPTRAVKDTDPGEVEATYWRQWNAGGPTFLGVFNDIRFDEEANETAAEFVRSRIRDVITDPDLAHRLAPYNHPIGTKRLCIDTGYYETFNRPNVELLDARDEPLVRVNGHTIHTPHRQLEVDVIVLATGFDAVTGALTRMNIRGTDGRDLNTEWKAGPVTFLGLGIPGYPNLFTITGPQSPGPTTNMIVSIEQHVDWIFDCLRHLNELGATRIEADRSAAEAWTRHTNEVAEETLFFRANSWFLGSNVPGKARVVLPYLGGLPRYREACETSARNGYDGFDIS